MKPLLFIFFLLPAFVNAQIISTIAGNGGKGFSGDGGPATSANLTVSTGVAVDKKGNVYFCDNNNNRVRKIDVTGIISTIAGNGTTGFLGGPVAATTAGLYSPSGVAVDTSGNIFIADELDHLVLKVDASGIMSVFAGVLHSYGYNGDGIAATAAKLYSPIDVATDEQGNVFIADQTNGRIRKVNNLGVITTIAGIATGGYSGDGGPATSANLVDPYALTVDKNGAVYYADAMNVVRKIDTNGIINVLAGMPDSTGFSGDGGPADSAKLNSPRGIYVDTAWNVLFSDGKNNRIRIVNTAGVISTFAGTGLPGFSGDGGMADTAGIYYPWGITGNVSGIIYFADANNYRVRKIGGLSTVVSGFISNIDTACQDSCIRFVNTSTGTIDSIRWIIPGLSLSNPHSDTINLCTLPSGIDTITLYVFEPGKTDTVFHVVTIKPTPHPRMIGSSISVPNVYLSYTWYSVDGWIVAGSTGSECGGCGMGAWYVVVDSGGCLGMSDTGFVWEGVRDIKHLNDKIKIHPNPATTSLIITSSDMIANVTILDLLGQTVYVNHCKSKRVEVDVSGLPAGMYLIRINGSEVRRFVKK